MTNYKLEELLPLWVKLTEKYTGKQSTSLPYDKAQCLMSAIVYCINENRRGENLVSETTDAELAYQTGYQITVQLVIDAKRQFEALAQDFHAYGNLCYYDTVIKGMPEFFMKYDPKFNPQDHILTLEYPTIKKVQGVCGIDAVIEYLSYLSMEDRFLKIFPPDKIVGLLSRYHNQYEELQFNLCSVVLRNVLGCMICDKKIDLWQFDKGEHELIRCYLSDSSQDEIIRRLSGLVDTLLQHGFEKNKEMYEYFVNDISAFTTELIDAADKNCLDTIFPY